MALDPLMLRAVILRAPQYERAVALLWNEWNRFVVSHPISPTTIALYEADLVEQADVADNFKDFIETNQQWLGDDAASWLEEWHDGRE
ncbi:hypothetical protein HAU11_00950 [Weissella confusa]|uniref:hypothetical protein n=1 Tax=Weissella confusa TaxID=1583 RepID=UPI0018F11E73|nr:hypothetical protein [Weissella confusa]MBJ7640209.1 hypothetical protein [Weissella confusa]